MLLLLSLLWDYISCNRQRAKCSFSTCQSTEEVVTRMELQSLMRQTPLFHDYDSDVVDTLFKLQLLTREPPLFH